MFIDTIGIYAHRVELVIAAVFCLLFVGVIIVGERICKKIDGAARRDEEQGKYL